MFKSQDEKEVRNSYTVMMRNQGCYKIGYRKGGDLSKLAENIKLAYRNAVEKSSENIVKKMDALGFSMEKILKSSSIDIEL